MGNDLKTRNEFLHSKRKQAELWTLYLI
jgi:hypothetical protein